MFQWFIIIYFICGTSVLISHDGFYAISSLRYHIDRDDDEIVFNANDIGNLWKQAAKEASTKALVEQAQTLYYQQGALEEASEILATAWNSLLEEYHTASEIDLLAYPNFTDNPLFDDQIKSEVQPYLLPLNHPIKPILDAIFNDFRGIINNDFLNQNGFVTISHAMRVVKHNLLPGYLIKCFLESEHASKHRARRQPGWKCLVERCEGAANIRRLIRQENIQHFVVPNKWLYPLSLCEAQNNAVERQLIILVSTDMDLADRYTNHDAWHNKLTSKHIEELYCIISHGLSSSQLCSNMPYTTSGKFACIDTEYPIRSPRYARARKALPECWQAYWDQLVTQGGIGDHSDIRDNNGYSSE